MTETELENKLKHMYQNAPHRQKSTMAHLFALLYADKLELLDRAARERIAGNATGVPSYATEFSKMIKLSQYVEIKTDTRKEYM